MKRHTLLTSIAALAVAATAPALADPGKGGGEPRENPGRGGAMERGDTMRDMGRMNSQGALNANERALERANENSVLRSGTTGTTTLMNSTTRANVDARAKSQGAAHANVNGLVHANERSALSTAGVTTLTGLATGLTVNNSGGTAIGTVDQIFTNSTGAVVGISVDLTAGGTVTLPATSLTMDGTTVVTSSTNL